MNPIIPLYKVTDKLIVKSKGCYQYDSEGKQYLDFESGDWAVNLGHSHGSVNKIIKKQVDEMIHDGLRFRNKQSEELANRLLELLSFPDGKCAFLNSGSEAVNLGITFAKKLTNRRKILKMDCSYLSSFGHGQISPENSDLVSIPFNDTGAVGRINFQEIAAFVFEPGNAWGLIKYPSIDFISAVAAATKQNGGLLMANEVTTGFGRTGKWFGFQHYDYKPDVVSIGKALGNGYPVSGIAINQEVAALFDKKPFRYAQSHQNDPLGCAVGLEVISVFEKEGLIQQSDEKGKYFSEQLTKLQVQHSFKIKDIKAKGLMLAIEFNADDKAELVYSELIEKGFLTGQKGNVLRFMPPLTIKKTQIDLLIAAIDSILKG